MGTFDKVKQSNKVEKTTDFSGGSFTVASDIYDIQVKAAYMGKAANSESQSVNLILLVNGKEIRDRVWITNRKGENFYTKNDKDIEMPGWTLIDELCQITLGKSLMEAGQETEEKVLKIYDPEEKKEIPKSVQCLPLTGVECSAAILEFTENKTKKNPSTGTYDPIEETITKNEVVKFFDTESHYTVVEAREEAESATYWDNWLDKNKGKTADRTVKVGGGTAGGPPKTSGSSGGNGRESSAPRQALFGKRK